MFALTSISPKDSYNEEDTPVVLVGDGFDDIAEVFLGATFLKDVVAKSPNVMNAVVPKGMKPDVYDVVALNKRGTSVKLEKGFTVNAGSRIKSGCGCNAGGLEVLSGALMLLALARRRL